MNSNVVSVTIPYTALETVSLFLMDAGFSEGAAGLLLEKNDITRAYGRTAANYQVVVDVDLNQFTIEMKSQLKPM